VLSLCTRIVVLHHGKLIAQGPPHDIIRNPLVIQAYLGRRYSQTGQEHA
jgi:branched-chain amino acid transport system ATP-binding protein